MVKTIAGVALTGVLAGVVQPAAARNTKLDEQIRHDAAVGLGEQVGIGIEITTGVLALVGGAVWYYVGHRREEVSARVSTAPQK
jgi:hypothetical protein